MSPSYDKTPNATLTLIEIECLAVAVRTLMLPPTLQPTLPPLFQYLRSLVQITLEIIENVRIS